MKKQIFEMEKPKRNRLVTVLFVVAILLVASFFFASVIGSIFGSEDMHVSGNVALISISGVILTSGGGAFDSGVVSSEKIVDYVKKADENPSIKAIIFEINSPGGSGVASEEVAQAIKNTNKTTVAFIREVGASGAYWIASATDRIFANRMSLTGSIGVTSSYLEFAGILKDYNITYRRLVAGKYKDMGSPFKQMTPEEEAIFQSQLDTVHEFFIEEVAKNRKLSNAAVRSLATGEPMLGIKAKEYGLIDEIGGKTDAVGYIERRLNITADLAEYKEKIGLLGLLQSMMSDSSYRIGFGIGKALLSENSPAVWT
jgi:protease-4